MSKLVTLTLVLLTAFPASAQDWTSSSTKDAFTDEEVWIANVSYKAGQHEFSLFVNCRDKDSLNVGLTGSYINPTGRDSRDNHTIATRFDSEEPKDRYFTQQGDVMFLDLPTLLKGMIQETVPASYEPTVRRLEQLFVKELADRSRLRIKFPQHGGDVVLDFPLKGAKDALFEVVQGCGTVAGEGTMAFLDAEEKLYKAFVDMLLDDTWQTRGVSYEELSDEERKEKLKGIQIGRRRRCDFLTNYELPCAS
ncbi:MAG: hypothetical protein OXU81_21005 [Gammaproteobacteria bacterium]|nr:hypothetical protein [Gammaproteobacteria bacterium]